MSESTHQDPPLLIPRRLYGTKKAVLAYCRKVMRHAAHHGHLPPDINDDLIDARSVPGRVYLIQEYFITVQEHFHMYCMGLASNFALHLGPQKKKLCPICSE